MNFASGLSKIFSPLRIYTESRRTHPGFAYDVGAIMRLQCTCSSISITARSFAWARGEDMAGTRVCAQHSNISAGFCGRMTFIYLIFYQIWEFVLPFCLQRLALLSICERFFCFSSQEISSLEGLDACLLSLSEFGQLKLWLLSPAVSPATHSREEQMMAKCSEQPSNNWKDLPVLIWQKAVSFSVV